MTSLADPAEIARRHALRQAPHTAPLGPMLADLRARHGEVPDPDPLDGGKGARILVLLESPGPRIRLSGIVSRGTSPAIPARCRAVLAEIARMLEDGIEEAA